MTSRDSIESAFEDAMEQTGIGELPVSRTLLKAFFEIAWLAGERSAPKVYRSWVDERLAHYQLSLAELATP